jgi:hypothetical protein
MRLFGGIAREIQNLAALPATSKVRQHVFTLAGYQQILRKRRQNIGIRVRAGVTLSKCT